MASAPSIALDACRAVVVDIEAVGVDVGHDRYVTGVPDRLGDTAERDCRHEHGGAWPQVHGPQGDSMAAVQEETATASPAPSHEANSVSNAAHSGPEVSHPDSSERTAAAWASGVTTGRVKATFPCVIHASSSRPADRPTSLLQSRKQAHCPYRPRVRLGVRQVGHFASARASGGQPDWPGTRALLTIDTAARVE